MPAHSSSVTPTLPGTLVVSILSPGPSCLPDANSESLNAHYISLLPPTEYAGGAADVHCWSELLHKHELLGVGVEDHHGHAAVTPGKDHDDSNDNNHDDNHAIADKDYMMTVMTVVYDK